jgi:hypothetical protein
VAGEVSLQCTECEFRALAAAAHLTQPNNPNICFDLDDGADKATPMCSVGMPEGASRGIVTVVARMSVIFGRFIVFLEKAAGSRRP